MTGTIDGKRILVVEDEYLLADDMRNALEKAGAEVLGPVPDVERAFALIGSETPDAALLDINLAGESVYSVADALLERQIPFIFATVFDESAIPERFASALRLEKPVKSRDVLAALVPLLG